MRELPNLDFLRACAVISVVVEHTLLAYKVQWIGSWQTQWIGVVGVFIFFVHTSLVLMWSLERKPHTVDFYIRRIFRIYPLAIFAGLVTIALHAPVMGTPTAYFAWRSPGSRSDLLGFLLLIPNIVGNYLPMSVMWSLPYEVEMYLALPVLFFFIRKNFSRWPLLLFWAFIVGISQRAFAPNIAHNFFLCIPYFLPGIMAYVGFGRVRSILPSWTFPLFLVVLWAVFMPHAGWRAANFLCLSVGICLPLFHQIKLRPLIAASHSVAKYSYGIYLAHPFGIVLGLYLMPHAPLAVQIAVIVLSTVVFAIGGYHLLEHPMIRLGSRLAKRVEQKYELHEREHFHRIAPNDIR